MSLLQEKNFQTRAVTGFLLVSVIVSCLFIHEYTFYALMIAIAFLCLREFYHLTLERGQKFFNGYTLCIITLITILLSRPPFIDTSIWLNTTYRFLLIAMVVLLFLLIFIQLFYSSEKPFTNIAFAYFGLFYISVPVLLMIQNTTTITAGFDPYFALLLFVLVWVNDTGAYIAGNLFGRTKLFERISPKKTWEGLIGGLALSMLFAAVYGRLVLAQSPLVFCGLGLVIGVFSTLGDLLESQLKRSLNIKDSGTLLPGHGGFLDRFDGFLMAMPAAYFYMLLVAQF